MPTYDYACQACGHAFEAFQSMSAKPLKKCPECGRLKLKRLIGTGAGIIFKGSGFYETDYRSESYKKSAEAEQKSEAGDKADAGKTDTKSDTGTKSSDKPADKASGSDKPASKSKGNRSDAALNRDKSSSGEASKKKTD